MVFISILQHYFLWHYTRAYYELYRFLTNLCWFIVHFFSIPQLLKTWFAPFKRITEERHKKWDFEDLAGRIIINLISRLIGFVIRGTVLLVGTLTLLVTILGGMTLYLLWFIVPALIPAVLVLGVIYLFI